MPNSRDRSMGVKGPVLDHYSDYRNLFIMPVWGDEYVEEFLEISLLSQLSAGNLGAMRPDESVYCIATSLKGKASIECSEAFRQLSKLTTTSFIIYSDAELDEQANPYGTMHDMYNAALRRVKTSLNCFFLTADLVCSDGVFAHAFSAMEEGKKVVFVPPLRVAKEPFVGSIRQRGISNALSPDEAVALILDHEHDITKAGIVNDASGAIFSLPSHTLFRLHNGYVGRWNVMHPLAVRLPPNPPMINTTVDWNYGILEVASPDEIEIMWNSDDGVVLTTSPREYTQGGRLVYNGTEKMRTDNLVRWLGCGWALNVHLLQMDGIVCLHAGPIDEDEYAKGIISVDRVWAPFRNVIKKHETRSHPHYKAFIRSPMIPRSAALAIRLRTDPIGSLNGAVRKVARQFGWR